MLDELAATCEATDCENALGEETLMLVFQTEAGERRAYECTCGAVTVTAHQ